MNHLPDELQKIADDSKLMKAACLAIDVALCECRDRRISRPFRGSGLVVKDANGEDNGVVRMGPAEAMRIGLLAIAKELESR